MSAADSRLILPQAPDELKQLSQQLSERVFSLIRAQGPIAFSRYMEMALYEPGLGYYSAGLRKFGEGGDFITAPELGSVFATCLASQVRQVAAQLGEYTILEIGAGTGRLAVDLLAALPVSASPSRYLILERSADLRKVQYEALQASHPDWLDRVEWLDAPPDEEWQGLLIANEVIDALPVERFRLASGQVQQTLVGLEKDQLALCHDDAPSALAEQLRHVLGNRLEKLPDGYHSEICPILKPWLDGLCSAMQRGCALFIDYGYPRREYYSAERSMGTLICHYRHHAHDDALLLPGLQDISAFVDFTALAEAGDACRLECAGYTSQAMFLLGCGLEQVIAGLEQLPDRERIELAGQVRQLTLPGAMGEKFQVMALSRDLDVELRGFEMLDLRHRL